MHLPASHLSPEGLSRREITQAVSRGLHDLAQPLTVLQGSLELALMQAETVEECREAMTAALAEAERVTATLKRTRHLLRLQAATERSSSKELKGDLVHV
jgi:signal transduction histidine kinase